MDIAQASAPGFSKSNHTNTFFFLKTYSIVPDCNWFNCRSKLMLII